MFNRVRREETLPGGLVPAPVLVVTLVILAGGILARILYFLSSPPLWIDETFTGAIASQKDFATFLNFAHADAPPSFLFYLIIHVWQRFFGLSDASLRFPSLIFSIAAPLLIVTWPETGLSRLERLTWGVLMAIWLPGIAIAADARCYAMLLFSATLQLMLFIKVLRGPSWNSAALWIICAEITIALNFDAAYLVIAQGLVLVFCHPVAALKRCALLLLFAPEVIDFFWKLDNLKKFEAVGTAWYPILHLRNLLEIAYYPLAGLGGAGILMWILGLAGLALLVRKLGVAAPPENAASRLSSRALYIAAWSSFGGALVFVVVGFIRPAFSWRYLLPFEPGLLLGFVLLLRPFARSRSSLILAAVILIGACADITAEGSGAKFWDFSAQPENIEVSSAFLENFHPRAMLFFWDSPTPRVMPPALLAAVGGFFLQRSGLPVDVMAAEISRSADPNIALPKLAVEHDASIIWLYDRTIRGTLAARFRPSPEQIGANYICKDFVSGPIGSLACYPQTPALEGR